MKINILLLMIVIITNSLFSSAASPPNWVIEEKNQRQQVVKIFAESTLDFAKLSITFHSQRLGSSPDKSYLVVNISDEERQNLHRLGFKTTDANEWIEKRDKQIESILNRKAIANQKGIPGYECYPTVEETYEDAEQLATNNPTLAEWIDIGDSWQKTQNGNGYDLMVLKITNQNIVKTKPTLFIHSSMHAREYTPAALNLDFAKKLINEYNSDPDINWLVDHHEIHLLFQMNPDGRKKAEAGRLWRKNNNTTFCNGSTSGVDLNRNFSYFWNTTSGGSSGNECAETYRGPSAGSEPETQAVESYIRSLFQDQRGDGIDDAAPNDASGMHIDIHSYSELVLWPYGHLSTPAPNGTALTTLGRKLARFNNYLPMQSVGLYPTDGTSDDVSYGELGIPSITFELGTNFFESCSVYENTIRPANLNALLYSAKVSGAPYMLPAGPDIVAMSGNGSSNPQLVAGTTLTLSVSVSDIQYNNSNGAEPTQTIASARYFVDEFPRLENSTPFALSSSDNAFDEPTETLTATIDTSNWSEGRHTIYFEAQDSDDNWGPVSAMFVTIGSNNTPSAQIESSCDYLECTFDGSSSTDDGTIEDYSWLINGNTSLSGEKPSYTFTEAGEYSIELTVTDNLGAQSSTTTNITVNKKPKKGGTYSFVLLLSLLLLLRIKLNKK